MDNNIIHEGHLKPDDSTHQMEMMMATAMMQMPNDYNIIHQSPHHHHHHHDHHDHHNAAAPSPPFMSLHSAAAQPFRLHQPHQVLPLVTAPSSSSSSSFLSGSTAGITGSAANHGKRNGSSSSSMAAMREMIFRMAVMQPVHIDPESVKPPKRRNVRISKDPQSVAARHRRERISERIRILQRLVPGGTKMDTASMLDEAIHYVKFLKTQVQSLERVSAANSNNVNNAAARSCSATGMGFPVAMSTGTYMSPHHVKAFVQNGTHQHFGDVFD